MAITKWDEYLIHQAYDTIDAGVEVDKLYVASLERFQEMVSQTGGQYD